MNDEAIKRAYAQAMHARGQQRAMCPAPEVVDDLAKQSRHADEALGTLDHVMSCRACRDDYELLRGLHRSQSRAAPRWGRQWQSLALAASVVAAVGVGTYSLRPRDVERGNTALDEVSLIAPVVPRGPTDSLRLVWRALPESEVYRVELLTTTGAILFSGIARDTTVAVSVGSLVTTDSVADWLVVARRIDGSETRSKLTRIRLTR